MSRSLILTLLIFETRYLYLQVNEVNYQIKFKGQQMRGKIFSYLLMVVGIILIIYGLTEFSLYSMPSIVALSVGIAFVGISGMALYTTPK